MTRALGVTGVRGVEKGRKFRQAWKKKSIREDPGRTQQKQLGVAGRGDDGKIGRAAAGSRVVFCRREERFCVCAYG